MIDRADSKRVIDIISPTEVQTILKVPKYQRGYAWGKKNWEQLFSDIDESDPGYFMGSIICLVSKTEEVTHNPILEIVDGQQRLATINLILSASYCAFNENEDILKKHLGVDEFISERTNIKRRLVSKSPTGVQRPRTILSGQESNKEDYEYLLSFRLNLISGTREHPRNFGNRRISKCFNYFLEEFEKLIKKNPVLFMDFYKKINETLLVEIDVKTAANAFTLFETLNTRGVPLSSLDLIKNKILEELEKQSSPNSLDIGEEVKSWYSIVESLDTTQTQVRFLRHYYYAFKNDSFIKSLPQTLELPAKPGKSNIVDIYSKIASKKAKTILNELKDKSKIYSEMMSPEPGDKFYTDYRDLINIGASSAYALILLCASKKVFDDKDYARFLNLIKHYYLRRNLTGKPGTNKLDEIMYGLIEFYYKSSSKFTIGYIFNYLFDETSGKSSTEDEFMEALGGNLYDDDRDICRYILTKIEESERRPTREQNYPDLWARHGKDYIITIEHILPEGKRLSEYWINQIAPNDPSLAMDLREKYVHTLGNLTLSGYNSNLSDSDFITKRDKKNSAGTYIGYKNNFYLNRKPMNLSEKNGWTIPDINKRTEGLIDTVRKLFGIASLKAEYSDD
jgi:uncharacterized protein with ParB-like and HNH nuclease domain